MAQEKISVIYDFVDRGGSGISSAIGGLASLGAAAAKIGVAGLAAAGAAMAAAGIAAINLGSDAEEMQGKFDVVFATMGKEVTANLDLFAAQVGRSKFELRGFAAGLGDTFKPMGFTEQAAADMATQVTKLAVDLGSFNNMETGEALQRLQSGLIGNHENLLTFGVRINEAILKEELFRMGAHRMTGAALEQAKAQARLNLIIAGTVDAQGDAARTSGSFANQMRGLRATIFDAGTEIGLTLLPMVTPLVTKFGELAKVGATRLVPVFEGMSDAVLRFFDLNSKGMPIVANVKTLIDALGDAVGLPPELTAKLSAFGGALAQMFIDMSNGVPKIEAMTVAFSKVATPEQQQSVSEFSKKALDAISAVQGIGENSATIFGIASERIGGLANQSRTLFQILSRNGQESKTALGGISTLLVEELTPAFGEFGKIVLPIIERWHGVLTTVLRAIFGTSAAIDENLTPAITTNGEKVSGWAKAFFTVKDAIISIMERGANLISFLDGALTAAVVAIVGQFDLWAGVITTIIGFVDTLIEKLTQVANGFAGAAAQGGVGGGAEPLNQLDLGLPSAGGSGFGAPNAGGVSQPSSGKAGKGGGQGKAAGGVTNIMNVNTNASSMNVQNGFNLMNAQAGGI